MPLPPDNHSTVVEREAKDDAAPRAAPSRGAPESLGRYRFIATLGHGGMAEVFLAVALGPAGFNKLVVI